MQYIAPQLRSAIIRRRNRRDAAYARHDARIAAAAERKRIADAAAKADRADGKRAYRLARLMDRVDPLWEDIPEIVQRFDDAGQIGRPSKTDLAVRAASVEQRQREDDLMRYAQRLAAKKYDRVWRRLEHL